MAHDSWMESCLHMHAANTCVHAVTMPCYEVRIAYTSTGKPLENAARIWAHVGHSGWKDVNDVELQRVGADAWVGQYCVPAGNLNLATHLEVSEQTHRAAVGPVIKALPRACLLCCPPFSSSQKLMLLGILRRAISSLATRMAHHELYCLHRRSSLHSRGSWPMVTSCGTTMATTTGRQQWN